jgi:hypothetical protein
MGWSLMSIAGREGESLAKKSKESDLENIM